MKRKVFFSFWVGVLLWSGVASTLAQTERQHFCPVMRGTPVKEKFFADYEGKRIYLCCAPCIKAFKKHPEKYLKNLKP